MKYGIILLGLAMLPGSLAQAAEAKVVHMAAYSHAGHRHPTAHRHAHGIRPQRHKPVALAFRAAPAKSSHYAKTGPHDLRSGIRVVDGDTFYSGGVRYRVRGIDTPERGQPMFEEAKQRLRQLLSSGKVSVESKAIDKYGRTVAITRVNGQDVAPILTREGYAKPRYLF